MTFVIGFDAFTSQFYDLKSCEYYLYFVKFLYTVSFLCIAYVVLVIIGRYRTNSRQKCLISQSAFSRNANFTESL